LAPSQTICQPTVFTEEEESAMKMMRSKRYLGTSLSFPYRRNNNNRTKIEKDRERKRDQFE
jgi:hypothetical protein